MAVSHETEQKFSSYLALLNKWQEKINLVSNDTLADARRRHIEDSIQLVDLIPPSSSFRRKPESSGHEEQDPGFRRDDRIAVFDLGSGAGFPGMVIAMMRPDLDMHLIESDSKKCAFLSAVSRETGTIVSIHNYRAEEMINITDIVPDIIVARALAPLPMLLRYCFPWAAENPHLKMFFMKGEKASAEILEAQKKYRFETISHQSRTAPGGVILEIGSLTVA